MYREFILFGSIVVVALFMTIHNSNLKQINQREQQAHDHKINRDNLLMKDGQLIRLGNGITVSKSANLIIIHQSESTIILNKEDVNSVIAFLEN